MKKTSGAVIKCKQKKKGAGTITKNASCTLIPNHEKRIGRPICSNNSTIIKIVKKVGPYLTNLDFRFFGFQKEIL